MRIVLPLILLVAANCAAQSKKNPAYGILLDNTGSMRSQFDTVRAIGKAVVQQVHDHGSVTLFDFHSQGTGPGARAVATLRIEATQDEETLDRGIDNFYVEGGQTSLLDAVKLIADSLNNAPDVTNKVIILITDGEDRVSDIQRRTLQKFLKDHGVKVFAVGLVQELDSDRGLVRSSTSSKAIDLLNSLAKETGGRAVFPKGKKIDLPKLLAELAIPVD